jgi:hypothetical protein
MIEAAFKFKTGINSCRGGADVEQEIVHLATSIRGAISLHDVICSGTRLNAVIFCHQLIFPFSASEWFSGKDKAPTATPSRSLPSLDTTDMYYTLDFSESQSSPLIQ